MRQGIHIGIPRRGSLNNAGFSPAQLGTIKSWSKGPDATFVEADSLVYSSLNDAGSLGGTFDKASNAHPVATTVAGNRVPIFKGTRRFSSSLAASNWAFLHNGTDDFTLTARVYLYDVTNVGRILSTSNLSASQIGVDLLVIGTVIQARFGNGLGVFAALLVSTVTLTDGNWFTIQLTKNGAAVALSVDGETLVTGTLTTPSAADPLTTANLGNPSMGNGPLDGTIAETVIHGVELDATGLALMRDYMSQKWSATPAPSFNAEADCWGLWDGDVGVTVSSGITAIADQCGYNSDLTEATNKPAQTVNDPDFTNHDSIDFDGVNDLLRRATLTRGTLAQPFAFAVIGTWDFDSGTGPFIMASASSASGVSHQSGKPTISAGLNLNATGAAPSSGTVFLLYGEFNGASSEIIFEVDGVARDTTSGDAGAGSIIGMVLGAHTAGSAFWAEKFALGAVYNGLPTTAGKERIIQLLRDRGDITPL